MKGSGLATGADARATERAVRSRDYEGLTRDELLDAYRLMLLSRKIDDKEIQIKNQSKSFFQISGAGHEAVLVAAARHLRPGIDWLFPYYRDRALCLTLGVTPLEMFLASVGAKDDPANAGRQMPSHWGHRRLNMPSQSSCVGTHCLHAVGAAEAGILYSRVTEIEGRESRIAPTRSRTSRLAKAEPARASSGSRSIRPRRSSCRFSISSKTTATPSRSPWTSRRRVATSRECSRAFLAFARSAATEPTTWPAIGRCARRSSTSATGKVPRSFTPR